MLAEVTAWFGPLLWGVTLPPTFGVARVEDPPARGFRLRTASPRRVGGIPEVIENNVTGLLAPFGDTAAFADAVTGLIRDPARRAGLGRAAQQRAREQFSAGVIVPRYEELYRRVCGFARR